VANEKEKANKCHLDIASISDNICVFPNNVRKHVTINIVNRTFSNQLRVALFFDM